MCYCASTFELRFFVFGICSLYEEILSDLSIGWSDFVHILINNTLCEKFGYHYMEWPRNSEIPPVNTPLTRFTSA